MANLPSGTITFLFTDIEGSTRLWEHQPAAMKPALARHDTLLREAIEARGGYVFKTVGDAFCAAFAEPTDALEAALAAQQSLQAEQWDAAIGAIRVRMAIHTGVAEERGGDYFGPPLNRVARLLSAGHGGQTLLTLATQELVRDNLPSKTTLYDLGEHRLKDLFRPEHVYQLNAPDLPAEFPALRTLDARATNLPAQPTPFIGRERELVALVSLLNRPDVRLVTLTGPGGTGKTRLSLQAAADLIDQYEHGAYFVALDTIRDSSGVIPQIASVLNVKPAAESTDLLSDLKEHLRERQLLLVLDNFEQVLEAGPAIGELVAAVPRLKVMVSSRAALNLYGEHDFPVPPLGLPDRHRKQTVAVISQYEAVALFIQRARSAKADFEITEENAPAIAEICYRLDGLPLAIELAAARVKIFPPQVMLERLSERLKTLTGGARNLPQRQQTLRGAIDWSYDLLDEQEKILFTRLGVFSGGWTLNAAETICGEGLSVDIASGLESLMSKNLIRETDSLTDESRFTMLETIHEYAVEKLEASPEADSVGGKHAGFVTTLIETTAASSGDAIRRGEAEYDNVRRAAEWANERGQPRFVVRLANALYTPWAFSPDWQEKIGWLEGALKQPDRLTPEELSDGNRALGSLWFYRGKIEQSQPYTIESLRLAREAGYRQGEARCLNNLANIASQMGDLAQAGDLYEQALAINLELGNLMMAGMQQGNLAELMMIKGEYGQARDYALSAIRSIETGDSILWRAWAWAQLTDAEFHNNHPAAAREGLHHVIELTHESGIRVQLIYCLLLAAKIATAEKQFEIATRLLAGWLAHAEAENLPPLEPRDQKDYDFVQSTTREALGEAAFQKAWEAGKAMLLDEAIKLAEQAPPAG
jgi:predicted ATPase/class 3 adenylate cyclase